MAATWNRLAAILAAGLLVVLIGHQLARLGWQLVYPTLAVPAASDVDPAFPVEGTPASEPLTEAVLTLFGRQDAAPAPAPTPIAPPTRLNLTLHGVMQADDPANSIAIIGGDRAGEQAYREGDRIGDQVVIRAIEPRRVLLEHQGRMEALELPYEQVRLQGLGDRAGAEAAPGVDGEGRVARSLVTNLAEISRRLRFDPVRTNGKLRGYRVTPLQDDAWLRQLGFRAGDTVTRVNGVAVNQSTGLVELFRQLEQQDRFVIEVENARQTRTLRLRLD